jgi:hypothetical protein
MILVQITGQVVVTLVQNLIILGFLAVPKKLDSIMYPNPSRKKI